MPLLDLSKLTSGLSRTWAGYLRDWDRCLLGQLPGDDPLQLLPARRGAAGALPGEYSPDPDADAAADDPGEVTRGHVHAFQAWMIETRSASTAVNKHKGLQQFFKWLLVDEQVIDRSPMDRVAQPKTPTKLVPVISDEATGRLLQAFRGKVFANLRDEALIRLYCNTGARLSEVGNLLRDDVDLNTESVHLHGKGAKDRRVRVGPKTARALSRYLRAWAKHNGAELPNLWLAERGGRPLTPNGIKIRIKRLGSAAGVSDVHAHRWRHSFAYQWKRAGGDTGDLMQLLGWTSEDMPRHYGASAAAERASEKACNSAAHGRLCPRPAPPLWHGVQVPPRTPTGSTHATVHVSLLACL